MSQDIPVKCPNCSSSTFLIKYEATYVYSYNIDSDAPGLKNTTGFLPFMFDKREQKDARQYLECQTCGRQFPYYLDVDGKTGIDVLNKTVKNI
ncbi:hypothetical protein CLHUN_14510 [Ruminiclostridium hungatei]|uniref:Uncharacterized protein n=1 Tax=Ruminiclostridium hungatei TaxID=48256 RepID=A0A1V4SNT9_RUMHU|nr:hypothetical protein [Ruminiclostridium hungatei]OPX44897.1 hypothetical protein CLHUN_14510 [Ruminiclostridium hungatei]